MIIKLLDLTKGEDHPFGNAMGKEVFKRFIDCVDSYPNQKVFEVSLEGIKATDSSFPRESIISGVKQYRGEHWFYLSHLEDRDLIDNWAYAAKAKQQSLIIETASKPIVIGPDITPTRQKLLYFVLDKGRVTTALVAEALDVSVQNASTKLKQLSNEGLILRSEESSLTGGKEYIYYSPLKI